MKVMKVIISLGIAVVLCGSTATADVLNGGFETGDTSAWTAGGTVYVNTFDTELSRDSILYGLQAPWPSDYWNPSGNAAKDPTIGNSYFASLWSTDNAGTNSSTLSQIFTVADPDQLLLQFDYFYDFGEWLPFSEDPATIWLKDGSASVIEEMTINDPVAGTGLAEDVNIDWTTVSWALPGLGTYELGFEISDSWGVVESILGVDNVQVVPVPGAFLLGAIGLGVANWRLRRRRMS